MKRLLSTLLYLLLIKTFSYGQSVYWHEAYEDSKESDDSGIPGIIKWQYSLL